MNIPLLLLYIEHLLERILIACVKFHMRFINEGGWKRASTHFCASLPKVNTFASKQFSVSFNLIDLHTMWRWLYRIQVYVYLYIIYIYTDRRVLSMYNWIAVIDQYEEPEATFLCTYLACTQALIHKFLKDKIFGVCDVCVPISWRATGYPRCSWAISLVAATNEKLYLHLKTYMWIHTKPIYEYLCSYLRFHYIVSYNRI